MTNRSDTMPYVDHYAQRQLIAHWLVAILVLYQFLFNGGANEAMRLSAEAGETVITGGMLTHGLTGALIGCVMTWRLAMRLRRGVPPPPDTEPRPIQILSRANHWAFYVVLIAMPVVGLLAIFTVSPTLARVHELSANLLFWLALLHIAGALWHGLFKRDGVITRMLRRTPPT